MRRHPTQAGTAAAPPVLANATDARPALGIALILLFCALAPFGDALAKLVGPRVPLLELMLVRFAMPLVLVPFVREGLRTIAASPHLTRLTLVRTLLHLCATGTFVGGLQYLELADAIAIAFAMPFVILLIGRFFGGERAGPRRILACLVGFAGTLLVVQPSFAEVGWPAALPLAAAVLFALFMLVTRQLAVAAGSVSLQAASAVLAFPLLLAIWIVAVALGWLRPALPAPADMALVLGFATIGVLAHLIMTVSLSFVSASTVAPIQYVEIPVATLIGWLMFGDWPDGTAAIGIAVIVAAGLAIIGLERRAMGREGRQPD